MTITELIDKSYDNAVDKGFFDRELSINDLLMQIVSEMAGDETKLIEDGKKEKEKIHLYSKEVEITEEQQCFGCADKFPVGTIMDLSISTDNEAEIYFCKECTEYIRSVGIDSGGDRSQGFVMRSRRAE